MGFEIINKIKKEKGLTNAQIAQLSGVTLSTLDKITSGANTNPKLDTLQAICSVLGCTLNDFVGPANTEKPPCTTEPSSEAEQDPLRSTLLYNFDQLNQEGQEFLVDMSDTMAHSPKYIKSDQNELGKAKNA